MENRKMTREEICEFLAKTRIEHEPTRFENISFVGEDLSEIAFMDCDFVNCNFSRCDLTNTNFYGSSFGHTSFDFCDMTLTNFGRCHFTGYWFNLCRLSKVHLSYSTLKNGGFGGCEMYQCEMVQIYQVNSSMTGGCIQNTTLEYSTLIDVTYYNTKFVDVDYSGADVHHITMDEVSLRDTDLEPLGDEVTVYGGFDNSKDPEEPVETYKEFVVHLLVNTRGETQVTLSEEV